jgi:hypothetical protein
MLFLRCCLQTYQTIITIIISRYRVAVLSERVCTLSWLRTEVGILNLLWGRRFSFKSTRANSTEMRYCEISKEMSSLYFGLAVLSLFEARVPEFDTQPQAPDSCGLYSVHYMYTEHCVKFWDSTSSPKYNDDNSLLI